MARPRGGHDNDKQQTERHASEKAKQRERPPMSFISLVCLGIAFAVTFAFGFHYWQQSRYVPAIWWGLASYIFVGIGLATYGLSAVGDIPKPNNDNPNNVPPNDPTKRAWLKVEPRISRPFRFESDGKSFGFEVTFQLTNVGQIVATEIYVNALLFGEQPHTMGNAIRMRDEGCAKIVARNGAVDARLMVYPTNQPTEYRLGINTATPEAAPVGPIVTPEAMRTYFIPTLTGCVVYRSGSTGPAHEVGFAYQVWWPDRKSGPNRMNMIDRGVGPIPSRDLQLTPHPMGGFYSR